MYAKQNNLFVGKNIHCIQMKNYRAFHLIVHLFLNALKIERFKVLALSYYFSLITNRLG